jgi:hypothetical protein
VRTLVPRFGPALGLALGLTLGFTLGPGVARAESEFTAGSGASDARLNLRVVIPYTLYFAVGPGATGPRVPNPTVTTITYTYTGAGDTLGNGTASGAVTVPVRIYCNGGPTTISVSHPTNLVSGSDTIPFTQILAASQDPANFPVPVMGGAAVNPPTNGASKITNRSANWLYRYANQIKPAPGTYAGTATYTAALL